MNTSDPATRINIIARPRDLSFRPRICYTFTRSTNMLEINYYINSRDVFNPNSRVSSLSLHCQQSAVLEGCLRTDTS
uniref:Predicted protein n=1 Tax=Hordeum vulgare subsp. vulgare TaxID=112509 RepID=F2EBX7_HORVV|nr:predicted protein [Hordeum vulgare subsp. vulgare]